MRSLFKYIPIALISLILLALAAPGGITADEGDPESETTEIKELELTSLTIDPSPNDWFGGPPGGQVRGGNGHYWHNPESVTVTAVPQDPGVTFTINGIPGTSGEPAVFPWGRWQPCSHVVVILTDTDGNTGEYIVNLTKYVEYPVIGVEATSRIVQAGPFSPNRAVTMTVRSARGGNILAEASGTTDEDGRCIWDFARTGIPVLLKPGMEVSVSDGETTATHAILPITVDSVDIETETIRGSGPPGAGIELAIWPDGWTFDPDTGESPEPYTFGHPWARLEHTDRYDPRFIIDSSGHWEVDLRPEGLDLIEGCAFDVTSSTGVYDYDCSYPQTTSYDLLNTQGVTSVFWPPSIVEPGISAILDLDTVFIEGVAPGIPVNLTVKSGAGGEALFSGTQVSGDEGIAGWGAGFDTALPVVLAPGMEVTVTWGDASRSILLDPLTVDIVNPETDSASGTGPAGEILIVAVGELAGLDFSLAAFGGEVPIGSDGTWEAVFSEDITAGMVALALLSKDTGITLGAANTAHVVPEVIEENVSVAEATETSESVAEAAATDGSLAQVSLPAGALPSGSTVEIAAIVNTAELTAQAAVPEDADLVVGFSIEAADPDGSPITAEFDLPATLTFTIDATMLPEEYAADDLRVAFWNGVRWVSLEDVQVVSNPDGTVTLTAVTNHFTLFAIMIDPVKAVTTGPTDPLKEVPFTGLQSLGIAPGIPQTEADERAPDESGAETGAGGTDETGTMLYTWIIGGTAVAVAVLLGARFFIRRKRGNQP